MKLVTAGAALCALLALTLPFGPVRLVFGAPLALFLPGYALTSAIFARQPLGWPHLLLLSVALSLVTLIFGALLLNYVPGGLRAITWALFLPLVVLASARATALHRPYPPVGPEWSRPRVSRGDRALLLGGLATAAAALTLAGTLLPAGEVAGYTQLWMLPLDGQRQAGVRVGVTNQETSTVAYRLRTRIHNRENVVRRFSLAPGDTRVFEVRTARHPRPRQPVRAVSTLYREDRPGTVYRRVSGWTSPPQAAR